MFFDCPLVGPEASSGGRLGERNRTEEENHSVHVPQLICQGLRHVHFLGCFNNSLYFWEIESGLWDARALPLTWELSQL